MTDYKDLTEVIHHVEGTLVISLIDFAYALEDGIQDIPAGMRLVDTLHPHTPGLYIPGEFEPLLKESEQYYTKQSVDGVALTPKPTAHMEGKLKNADNSITDFKTSAFRGSVVDTASLVPIPKKHFLDIPTLDSDIHLSDMTMICSRMRLKQIKKYLKPVPTIPSMAIKMAVAVIKERLELYCPHTTSTSLRYNQRSLVQPEYHHLIDQGEYTNAFFDLNDKLIDFTRNAEWNLYFLRLQGTSLVITKGLDWRIYEYYRMKFEKESTEVNEFSFKHM